MTRLSHKVFPFIVSVFCSVYFFNTHHKKIIEYTDRLALHHDWLFNLAAALLIVAVFNHHQKRINHLINNHNKNLLINRLVNRGVIGDLYRLGAMARCSIILMFTLTLGLWFLSELTATPYKLNLSVTLFTQFFALFSLVSYADVYAKLNDVLHRHWESGVV